MRVRALNDLTAMSVADRYRALNVFISAMENDPALFPRENDKDQSLFQEIITACVNDNTYRNKKEYIKERMMYLQVLNRFLRLSMQHKFYYEMAKILYQKYLYGMVWSQETLDVYEDKSAATEFEHAKNAAIANLHLLLKVAKEERTKNYVRISLEKMGEM